MVRSLNHFEQLLYGHFKRIVHFQEVNMLLEPVIKQFDQIIHGIKREKEHYDCLVGMTFFCLFSISFCFNSFSSKSRLPVPVSQYN